MKTLLVGNFGDYNLGDELILSAALEKCPGAIVMTSDASFSEKFTEQDFVTTPFPPTGLRSWWRFITDKNYSQELLKLKLRGVDRVVFPGGGLFAIKWQACFLWWCVFRFCRKYFPRAEIRFEHQGIDKGLGFLSKKCVQSVFKNADFISVRDEASRRALVQLGIEDVEVKEDRVWAWLKQLQVGATISVEKLVLVNALSSFDIADIEQKYPDHNIIFIALALSDIATLPDDFVHEVVFPQTKTELFDLMVRAEVLVGERFHSLVLGAHFCGAENTFTLKNPYSEKVESFCKEQGITRFA